jgi:hypothetical protein
MGLLQIKKLLHSRRNRIKRWPTTEWEKIINSYPSGKELISAINKGLKNLSTKRTSN